MTSRPRSARPFRQIWIGAFAVSAAIALTFAAPAAQTAQVPQAPAGTKKALTIEDYSKWRTINVQWWGNEWPQHYAALAL